MRELFFSSKKILLSHVSNGRNHKAGEGVKENLSFQSQDARILNNLV